MNIKDEKYTNSTVLYCNLLDCLDFKCFLNQIVICDKK